MQKDAEIVVVGPEGARRFRRVWEEKKYPFVGLADHRHVVANLYGQEVKLLKAGRMPGVLVIDKGGVIRFAHFGHDMADIPKNAALLRLLDGLNNEAAQGESGG